MITEQKTNRPPQRSTGSRPANRQRPPQKRDLSKTFGNLTPSLGVIQQTASQKPEGGIFRKPALRIVPLGGLEEVGKNMTVVEYGDDIMVIDMGLMFPNEDMPGIDYVLPDVSYLVENKHKIRGIIITHGHLDHTGAIPYLYEKLGSPQIYSAPLTIGLIKKRLEEFGMENKVKLATVTPGEEVLHLGCFRVETFRLNHNIPDSMGLAITTPEGILVYCTDWKFDHTPADGRPTDFSKLAQLGGEKVLALFSDSTNAQKPGHTISEKEVEDVLFKLVENAKGRVIIATFSSLISRIQQILNVAQKLNRKVAFSGRSMVANVDVAASLEALMIPKDTMIDVTDIGKYSDNRVIIVCTGSQGEERSALTRIAAGEHRQIRIQKGDTVVLSSSPIPGNERSVNDVMDNLFREGARVIYQKLMDVHTSGHAYQEDLKLMIGLIKPKFFIPVHGERHKLMVHAGLAQDVGIPEENILVSDNGQIMEFQDGRGAVTNKRVPASYVMVDGLGVGDVGNIVLRDRKAMAEDGIFVIIVTVNHETGQIVTSPDIISRGFIYMRENEDIVHKARAEIKRLFAKHTPGIQKGRGDWGLIKTKLREELGDFLYKETERRPMVIPVVIEV